MCAQNGMLLTVVTGVESHNIPAFLVPSIRHKRFALHVMSPGHVMTAEAVPNNVTYRHMECYASQCLYCTDKISLLQICRGLLQGNRLAGTGKMAQVLRILVQFPVHTWQFKTFPGVLSPSSASAVMRHTLGHRHT